LLQHFEMFLGPAQRTPQTSSAPRPTGWKALF